MKPNTSLNQSQIIQSENVSHSENTENLIIDPESENLNPTIKNRKRNYKQKYVKEWELKFEWLQSLNEKAYCKICNVHVSGSFFHLRRHEMSSSHKSKLKAAKNNKKIEKLMVSSQGTSLAKNIQRAELKWCALLCQKNIPIQIIDDLIPAMADIYSDSMIAKSCKLKRCKATKIIVNTLGPSEEQNVISSIKLENCYFSLIVDETTDVGTKKALVLIARLWNESNFEVEDHFLSLIELKECTGAGIYESIHTFMEKHSIPKRNIIGLAADNCNVMMGDKIGVKAQIKRDCPNIFILGCSCHSLHLCASHASEKLPNSVESFLRDVHNYFSKSSQRVEELNEFQDFCSTKNHKILYFSTTRWLSRGVSSNSNKNINPQVINSFSDGS